MDTEVSKLVIVKRFNDFNARRYSNPWIAIVNKQTGKIDFSQRVGGYTGRYGAGEAGELYLANPQVGAIYAYGQKDYRGSNTYIAYVIYHDDGKLEYIDKSKLIEALNK